VQARIVAYLNGARVLCVPISEAATGIGRDADNAVLLPAPEVSKHHAVLRHTPEGWHIWDRESRNGLFVNGRKARSAILKNGDEVGVGP
jgi:pSer/pThr/pTyr-binding forkhead associated (FHA) protein